MRVAVVDDSPISNEGMIVNKEMGQKTAVDRTKDKNNIDIHESNIEKSSSFLATIVRIATNERIHMEAVNYSV